MSIYLLIEIQFPKTYMEIVCFIFCNANFYFLHFPYLSRRLKEESNLNI